MMYGALQTGQDINNVTDLDAVWSKVRESKRQVLKYFTSGAEQTALFFLGMEDERIIAQPGIHQRFLDRFEAFEVQVLFAFEFVSAVRIADGDGQ